MLWSVNLIQIIITIKVLLHNDIDLISPLILSSQVHEKVPV